MHKGTIIDTFVGIPQQKVLEQFLNTAVMIETLSKDENMMKTAFAKAEEFIGLKDYDNAIAYLKEIWMYENWRD